MIKLDHYYHFVCLDLQARWLLLQLTKTMWCSYLSCAVSV